MHKLSNTKSFPNSGFSNKFDFENFILSDPAIFGQEASIIYLELELKGTVFNTPMIVFSRNRKIFNFSWLIIAHSAEPWSIIFERTVRYFPIIAAPQKVINCESFKETLINSQQNTEYENLMLLMDLILTSESSITLVMDEENPDIEEIAEHYTQTWQKWVKMMYLKEFNNDAL